MLDKNSWGQLMTINLYDCSHNKLIDKNLLIQFCKLICKEIDMVPHGEPLVERFGNGPLEGYSLMQFIETSSITIHLDEVWNRAYIDIFSCKAFDKIKAKNFSKNFFEAQKVKYKNFYR